MPDVTFELTLWKYKALSKCIQFLSDMVYATELPYVRIKQLFRQCVSIAMVFVIDFSFCIKYLAQVWKIVNNRFSLNTITKYFASDRKLTRLRRFLLRWLFRCMVLLHVTWLVAPLSRKVLRKFFTQPFSCSLFLWKFS